MQLKPNIPIISILAIFIISNIIFLSSYQNVWWDSSVYIGMGKYIYSSGNSGLWESSRPLIMPLILGLGWALGLDTILFGRIVSILFSVAVIFMIYIIGLKVFSKKTALLASFFTAFSFNFLFFSPNILTEIPSTFFVLIALYFFLENRFFLMGLFSGLAIMARFFQAFTLIGLALVFFFYLYRKPNFWRKVIYVFLGALIIILPYILLNHLIYNDILLPFKVQTHLTKTTGWTNYQEYGFYFIGLFKDNFLISLLLTLPFFFMKSHKFTALLTISSIYLLIFTLVKHKEMRYMLQILPFLSLLLSHTILELYKKINYEKIAKIVFFAALFVWISITINSLQNVNSYKDEGALYFQEYLKNTQGNIWVTNPLYALHSDSKISGLLYFYSSNNLINFIDKNKDNVEIVLFNSCDIPCNPTGIDPSCDESRNLLNDVLSKFKKIYEKELYGCIYIIYNNPIILT